MQVSHNELAAVLKQAFEGCGFDAGRYENATQMVLWLQTHGLEGLTLLAASLDRFKHWTDSPFEVVQDSKQALLFDVKGQSILSVGALVSDLIVAKALDAEFCVGTIRNVQDHVFIAKRLIDAQSADLHGVAYWQAQTEALESGGAWQMFRTSKKPVDGTLVNNACSLCPCLDVFNFSQHVSTGTKLSSTNLKLSSTDFKLSSTVFEEAPESRYQLVLAYAKDRAQLDQILSKQGALTPANLLTSTSAASSQAHYQYSLDNGIEVSTQLWDRLLDLGSKVLVQSSEQSRKGAGA